MKTKLRILLFLFLALAFSLSVVNAAPVSAAEGSETPKVVVVKKTAVTTFDRTWKWDIGKTGDKTNLTLSPGQVFDVNYAVTVSAVAVDSNWKVTGRIEFLNSSSVPATIESVSDVISGGIVAAVDCGTSFPFQLPAGFSKVCTYSADLPDGSARTNTATVTTSGDVPGGSITIPFSFGAPANEYDECIDVTDDQFGSLGTVCAGQAPKTFNYTLTVGPYAACGLYQYKNVASFITKDKGVTGSDDHVVVIDVPCAGGCTLTPGYWKTHSSYGPAPYDATWALIGENTAFFLSGQSWYQVLWTSPSGGNAYYILAHAYIAARLNLLNDAASTPEVDAALVRATTFFSTYTPASTLSRAVRNAAIADAGLLDGYNNGLTGPGHCDF